MGYIFVLYSSYTDQKFAQRLVSDLRRLGIDARSAQGELKPDGDWSQQAKAMKNGADIQLYILDEKMLNASSWVTSGNSDFMFVTNYPASAERIHFANVKSEKEEDKPVISFYNGYDVALESLLSLIPKELRKNDALPPEVPLSLGYVFVSYAEEDTEFVLKLRRFLEERGYGYWDYQSSDRNYQTQLFLELEDVIQNAAATLSILSPDWKRSAWAAKEYLFSAEVGTPVFLLMARTMGPTLVTAGVTYIDFVRDPDSGFAKLDRELRRKGLI